MDNGWLLISFCSRLAEASVLIGRLLPQNAALTVDDGVGQDGGHAGLLGEELDSVQQPGWIHAPPLGDGACHLELGAEIHNTCHKLLPLQHISSGRAPYMSS